MYPFLFSVSSILADSILSQPVGGTRFPLSSERTSFATMAVDAEIEELDNSPAIPPSIGKASLDATGNDPHSDDEFLPDQDSTQERKRDTGPSGLSTVSLLRFPVFDFIIPGSQYIPCAVCEAGPSGSVSRISLTFVI